MAALCRDAATARSRASVTRNRSACCWGGAGGLDAQFNRALAYDPQGHLLARQEAGTLQPFTFEADGAGLDGFAKEVSEGFNGQEASGHSKCGIGIGECGMWCGQILGRIRSAMLWVGMGSMGIMGGMGSDGSDGFGA